jgi:hypothetical protein
MASRKRRRSQEWFGRDGKMGFIYRSWVKNRGIPHDQFDGRPVIGSATPIPSSRLAIRTSARSRST